jgi:hypothetical protein
MVWPPWPPEIGGNWSTWPHEIGGNWSTYPPEAGRNWSAYPPPETGWNWKTGSLTTIGRQQGKALERG